MISDKKVQEAARELALYLRHAGLHWTLAQGFLQRIARRLLNGLPGGKHLHRRQAAPAWLTSAAAQHLSTAHAQTERAFENRGNLVGALAAMGSSGEIYTSNQHMLELRHPYRDRRLIEYALGLPAYLLYYRGLYKRVLRIAMRNILPEPVRTRPRQTSLASLFSYGTGRERTVLQTCFNASDAVWRIFVRSDWLLQHWDLPVTPDTDGPQALVPWLCASYSSWYRSYRFLQ